MKKLSSILVYFSIILVVGACSRFADPKNRPVVSLSSYEDLPSTQPPHQENNGVLESHGENTSDSEDVDYSDKWPDDFEICSDLNFKGVSWPDELTRRERPAFGLALNITGSFEGSAGWTNIANNFDDQGMSLGLLQQNFGQGSLQPLLINTWIKDPINLESNFKADHLSSLLSMLRTWEGKGLTTPQYVANPKSRLWDMELSGLDEIDNAGMSTSFALVSPKNRTSVDWALSTIYANSTTIKPEWKTAFQSMARTPSYISEQIDAARYLHERAQAYMVEMSFSELRSYLFFFDIAVQNGGIPSADRQEFSNWEKSHPRAREEERILQLLEIRLRRVRSQYREDVRQRKTTIILNKGVVHGRKRDLPQEYCYDPLEKLY